MRIWCQSAARGFLPSWRERFGGATLHAGALALIWALAGCASDNRDIDPFPVALDVSAGAAMAFASIDDRPPAPVTLDTLSPITILDPFETGGEIPEERRIAADLTLYSAPAAGEPIPRITLAAATVFDLHPCDTGGPAVDCLLGVDDETRVLRGIIGADLLSRAAVRFDFSRAELRFFPDTAGTDTDRGELCEAVFDSPFAGGGTLIVADGEVPYIGRRPAVGACLDDGLGDPLTETGVDAQLVIATGLGISILSESVYDRYAAATGAPLAEALPDGVVHLASGPAPAKLGQLGQISLSGDIGKDSQKRGPCGELFASRVLAFDRCATGEIADCPCPDAGDTFCRAAAVLVLSEPIDVAVLGDEHPLLQALRVELRPEFAEVDGLLGAAALAATRIEFDYPKSRIISRCMDPARCEARPQILVRRELERIQACLPPP